MIRRLSLVFAPQPESGYTLTSPVLPELVTEEDALEDAFAAASSPAWLHGPAKVRVIRSGRIHERARLKRSRVT